LLLIILLIDLVQRRFGTSHFEVYKKDKFEYLHISNANSNKDNLVLLHGMFGSLSNYDPLLKEVQGYNIYVPKIPIYDPGMREISIQRLTEWLRGFFNELDIQDSILL